MTKLPFMMAMFTFAALHFPVAMSSGQFSPEQYQQGNMPYDMHAIVVRAGCEPVRDYYSSSLVRSPPYIELAPQDFIAICEQTNDAAMSKYKLIVRVSDYHPMHACPWKIELPYKPLGFSRENIEFRPGLDIPALEAKFEIYTDSGDMERYTCSNGKWEITGRQAIE